MVEELMANLVLSSLASEEESPVAASHRRGMGKEKIEQFKVRSGQILKL